MPSAGLPEILFLLVTALLPMSPSGCSSTSS